MKRGVGSQGKEQGKVKKVWTECSYVGTLLEEVLCMGTGKWLPVDSCGLSEIRSLLVLNSFEK